MPAYHVSERESRLYESRSSAERARLINEWCLAGAQTEFGDLFEFIAPYSNNFLCHRNLFSMIGGYCTEFRGHGSEDFDFLIRLSIIASELPLPSFPHKDFYSPLSDAFWEIKDYAGFRRLLELFTFSAESLGLKSFHIWHPRPREQGYWISTKDWNRERFNEIVSRYLNSLEKLLDLDFLPRAKKALCVFSAKNQWSYFLPLRLVDYHLSFYVEHDPSFPAAMRQIEKKEVDRIFIFSSCVRSGSQIHTMIELAHLMAVQVTVVDYGSLPHSICFANDDDHSSPGYKHIAEGTLNNREAIEAIYSYLQKVSITTEARDVSGITGKRYMSEEYSGMQRVLIPLQLQGTFLTNKRSDGYISYTDFVEGIKELVRENASTLFFIEQQAITEHDLGSMEERENVVIYTSSDNIHEIIMMSDAVLVYTSDVALLSVLHDKPVYHCGKVFFGGGGKYAIYTPSPPDLTTLLRDGVRPTATAAERLALLNWLIQEKYSFFYERDSMQTFGEQKTHHAKNIFMEQLVLDGQRIPCGLGLSRYPFSWRSYVAGHLTMVHESQKGKVFHPSDTMPMKSFRRKLRKLLRSPRRFFSDAVMKHLR